MLASITVAATLDDDAASEAPAGSDRPDADGRWIALKPSPTSTRPTIINGIEYSRIRRRPTRSMSSRAPMVKMKLVVATVSDVSVGTENPSMVKMVAEKYINEFWPCQSMRVGRERGRGVPENGRTTYKTTQLRQGLQHAGERERASVLGHRQQRAPRQEPGGLLLAAVVPAEEGLLLLPDLVLDVGQDAVLDGRAGGAAERPPDHAAGGGRPPDLDEPARRLGHEEHEEALDGGGQGAEPHHPPPARRGVAVLGEDPADDVGDGLAEGNGHVVHGHEAAAVGGGRQLGDVHGRHEAGGADTGAHHGAAQHHGRHGVAAGLGDGAEDEEHVCQQDHTLAAECVGKQGGQRGRDEGEERGHRRDDGLVE